MCNPDYIFWTASEAFGRWFAPQTKRFWTVIKLKNVFLHVFLTKLMPFPPFFLPSLPVNSLIFSQFLTLSSPLLLFLLQRCVYIVGLSQKKASLEIHRGLYDR